MITNAELRAFADNAEGTGAYRKLADAMRAAVLALGERIPSVRAPKRTRRTHAAPGGDGGGAARAGRNGSAGGRGARRAAHCKPAAADLRTRQSASQGLSARVIRPCAADLWTAALSAVSRFAPMS